VRPRRLAGVGVPGPSTSPLDAITKAHRPAERLRVLCASPRLGPNWLSTFPSSTHSPTEAASSWHLGASHGVTWPHGSARTSNRFIKSPHEACGRSSAQRGRGSGSLPEGGSP